eukprot:TRINITY_DN11364_c1_g1_i1.p1 TRINITY_DN11364_c1_g1~~TRINITY_DN11364_c1_g1_i1.p1  ORF type:complete len:117 (-),score=20.92 TRINITY_DN11364_c1_g1_i1:431-781(-)
MTSGLQRVARALCELDANPPEARMDGKPLWQDYLPEAQAAIMALREPDMTMISAAALEAGHVSKDEVGRIYRAMTMISAAALEAGHVSKDEVGRIYRAMIDAAMIHQVPTAGKAER